MGYLSQSDHKIVSDAVAAAELTTSGEIVTVLADRSDGYSDVVLVWAVALALASASTLLRPQLASPLLLLLLPPPPCLATRCRGT